MTKDSGSVFKRRRFLSLAAAGAAGTCLNSCDNRGSSAAEDQVVNAAGLEKDHLYWMPIHFGARSAAEPARTRRYDHATILVVRYVTSAKQVAAIGLPPGFTVLDPPVVTVKYCSFSGVDFMGGGGYNLVSVNIGARFQGNKKPIEGDYCLVVWENSFLPILLGREVLGVPKIYADIPDHWSRGNSKRWVVSENGYSLCQGELSELFKVPASDVEKMTQQPPRPWMGWKYIPSIDRASADVSYPTLLPSFEVENLHVWTGTGKIRFFVRSFEESPIGHAASTALAQLPVEEVLESSMSTASMTLAASACRRLE